MTKLFRFFAPLWFLAFAVCPVFAQSQTPRSGHSGKINDIAVSGDSSLLASASNDETVRIWDIASGREVLIIKSDAGEETFEKVAFSFDGKLVASKSSEGIKLWDAKSGKITKKYEEYDADWLAFSPDNKWLAAGGGSLVSLLNLSGGADLSFDDSFGKAVFHPRGTHLATRSENNSIKIRDLKTGLVVRSLGNTANVDSMIFNPSGSILAVVSRDQADDNYVELWNTANGLKIKSFPKTKIGGLCAFTADGKSLIVNSAAFSTVDFSDPDSLFLLNPLNGVRQGSLTISSKARGDLAAFSPDRQMLAVVGASQRDIYVFDLLKKKETQKIQGYSVKTTSLVFAPDDKTLLAGYDDGSVVWWDTASGKLKKQVSAPLGENAPENSAFDEVVVSPDGNYFLAASRGLRFFAAADGRPASGEAQIYQVANGAFAPDGKTFALVGSETITIYEVPGGKILNRFVHRFPKTSYGVGVFFSPDGKILITALDTEIVLWDAAKGTTGKTFKNLKLSNSTVALSPDNRLVILAPDSFNSDLRVFETETEKTIYEFKDLENGKEPHFAVSPDGKTLATVNAFNESLELYELATGKLIRASKIGYDADSEKVLVAFNRDGSLVAVGGANGVKLFKTATAEEVHSLK